MSLSKFIILVILIMFSSCNPIKIIKGKDDRWLEAYTSKDRKFFQLHVFFDSSLKGDHIFIKHNREIQMDTILNEFTYYKPLGNKKYYLADNSGEIELKINEIDISIESGLSNHFKYLIITKKSKKKYTFLYTNYINGGVYEIGSILN